MTTRYLSIKAVAELLSVSPSTVRNMIRRRQLPAVRTGAAQRTLRVAESDLEAYLAAHRVSDGPGSDAS